MHPSGVDQSMHQSIDTLAKLYGDKHGVDFQVWVDRVSFAQISLGSWMVMFNKWELAGEVCLLFGLLVLFFICIIHFIA